MIHAQRIVLAIQSFAVESGNSTDSGGRVIDINHHSTLGRTQIYMELSEDIVHTRAMSSASMCCPPAAKAVSNFYCK